MKALRYNSLALETHSWKNINIDWYVKNKDVSPKYSIGSFRSYDDHKILSHDLSPLNNNWPATVNFTGKREKKGYIYIIYGKIMNLKATLHYFNHLSTTSPQRYGDMYINYTTKWYDKLCYKHLYTQ